jgi:hypothetical protein
MAKYGSAVLSNGWSIVPIRPGSKAPLGLDWRKRPVGSTMQIDAYEHEYWVDKAAKTRGSRTWSVRSFGIGVLTDTTVGVDIDVKDESVSAHMVAFVNALLPPTIERVGDAPKTLMVYRTEHAFPKVNSGIYLDGQGRRTKLEVLAAGQQFVALAVHPDTKQPYRWKDKRGPHNTPVDDLPVITLDDARAIRDEFDRVARSRGWTVVTAGTQLVAVGNTADDDPFADVAPKVTGVSDDEMRRLTMLVPGYEDYESWREIGMALYHQYDGSDVGLSIWDEWSEQAGNYDATAVHDKWPTFDIDGKGRSPLTARVILERSKAAEAERVEKATTDAITAIMQAQDTETLTAACLPLKSIAFDELTRNMLIGKLQQRYKDITKTTLGRVEARAMLRYRDTERVGRFTWLNGFVYVQFEDLFYNVLTGRETKPRAFDASYSRHLLSPAEIAEGKSKPDHAPSDVARNVVQIPLVSRRMYMPGFGDLFTLNGEEFVNRFTEASVPDAADEWTVAGRAAADKVEAHARFLFSNDRDRGLFLDYLAYIVQTNERVSWSPFIQGVGGDGKSFWGYLMQAVLGWRNADVIRGAELKEKYTPWAEGSLFVMIEEVRLTGEHRWDAVNNIKPYITDARVSVRRMGTDIYSVINRTSYVMTSNFKDGLPASEGDRYFPIYSRWQDRDAFVAWKAANPSYFAELWDTLSEAPSLRRWLLERKLSSEFNAKGRAPDSSNRDEMRALVVDDESAALKRMLDGGNEADFSRTLLDRGRIAEEMLGCGVPVPQGRRLAQLMAQSGMTFLGETGFGGRTRGWWSDQPELFQQVDSDGKTKINPRSVEKWLDNYL